VNLERAARSRPDNERGVMSPTDTLVRIEQGELLCGIVDKRTVGSSGGSLIHVIWNECGPEVCKDFLNEAQHIITYFLQHHSSSIGIGDTIASEETLDVITTTIRTARREVSLSISREIVKKAVFKKRQPGITLVETFE